MQDRREAQREAIKDKCAQAGITISPHGEGYRLRGRGVCLLIADLADLKDADLVPYQPQ